MVDIVYASQCTSDVCQNDSRYVYIVYEHANLFNITVFFILNQVFISLWHTSMSKRKAHILIIYIEFEYDTC